MQNSKFIIVLVFFVSNMLVVNAQSNCNLQYYNQRITGNQYSAYYLQYNGSPFINDEWQQGTLTLVSGEVYHNLKMNYDIYRNTLLYYNQNNRRIISIDNSIISSCYLRLPNKGIEYHIVKYTKADTILSAPLIILLHHDTLSLYMRKRKDVEASSTDKPRDGKYYTFYDRTDYFFDAGNGLIQLPNRKRKFCKLMLPYAPQISGYISKNRLSVKNPEHLVNIFTEINRALYQNRGL